MKVSWTSMLVAFLMFANGCQAQQEGLKRTNRPTRVTRCRFFEDPSTHVRWMLFEDTDHPALPARLMPVAEGGSCSPSVAVTGSPSAPELHRRPIIHALDALTIAQHTPFADVHLEAIALGPAAAGQTLRVRLKSSGLILPVRVDGPGRATMITDKSEVRW